jgi:prepilin-type N-terminal cleavage/methylation domain-containing protein
MTRMKDKKEENIRPIRHAFGVIRDIRDRNGVRGDMKRQGYTLVEMLVVLAIIALLMAIVVPRFTMSQKGEGLKGAATELTTALRTARRIAITKREVRALALDIYSIPAEFMIMRWNEDSSDSSKSTWVQDKNTETHKFTDDNVAVVAVENTSSWTNLDIKRTDDTNLDMAEEPSTVPLTRNDTTFNPQIGTDPTDATYYGKPCPTDGHVTPIYHLIKFQPTGTADKAIIYLWNIEQDRQEIPTTTNEEMLALGLSNISKLGVPPGLIINDVNDQSIFFKLLNSASPADSYYYTLVVNPITGGVMVYDYAWGTGSGTDGWDRKKDGES